jgi:hypothetical protein
MATSADESHPLNSVAPLATILNGVFTLPSASGALFSSFIVSLHTMQFKSSGLLSSLNDILRALARDHFPFAFGSASRAAWIVSEDVSYVR